LLRAWKLRGDAPDQGRVCSPSSCQYYFIRQGGQVQAVVQGERAGGEFGERRDFFEPGEFLRFAQDIVEERLSKQLPPRAFGRRLGEIAVLKPFFEQHGGGLAAGGPFAASIHRQAALGQMPHHHVN